MDFLFDLGRVLLDFDFDSSMQRLLKNSDPAAAQRLIRAIDARDDFESGLVEPAAFVQRSIHASGAEITPEAFISAWRNIFTRNPPMWETVNQLKATRRHRLILFSNTNAIHCPWVFQQFPELEIFDARVLSYQVGAMKPHPAIYQHAIREFSLDPLRTRYIDDLPENIARGQKFGFRCHLYHIDQHDDFTSWLNAELAMES